MSSTDRPTIDDIILAWADQYNNRIPVPEAQRKNAFLELLKTFDDNGYTKEDLTTRVRNDIISTSVNENHFNKSKLKIWKDLTSKYLAQCIISHYGLVEVSALSEEEKRKDHVPSGYTSPERPVEEKEKKLLDLSKFAHIKTPPIEEDLMRKELGFDDE